MGVVLIAAMLTTGAYFLARGGHQGHLIDIDRAGPQTVEFMVDVNEATWPELSQLPDIGEALARRIVESRELAGPYLDHDDLIRVKGIGPKTLERVRPHLLPMPEMGNMAGP